MSNILLLPGGEPTRSQMIALSSLGSKKCIALGGEGIISKDILQGIEDMLK
jgi:hypothetical protein